MTCGLQRRVRALTLSIVTVASLGGAISTAVAGDIVHPIQFAIPAQPLDSALRALARQADIQILFAPSVAVGSMAPAITGEMSARKALELLLSSTPLEFTVQDEDTIIVRQKTAHESPRKPTPASSSGAAQVPDTAALQEIVVTAQKRS